MLLVNHNWCKLINSNFKTEQDLCAFIRPVKGSESGVKKVNEVLQTCTETKTNYHFLSLSKCSTCKTNTSNTRCFLLKFKC